MKCYTVTGHSVNGGCYVSDSPDGPAIVVGSIQAKFSEGLAATLQAQSVSDAFTLSSACIHRCDVDKRSEIWLVPETERTRAQALVSLSWSLFGYRPPIITGCVEAEGPNSDVLTYSLETKDGSPAVMALARLSPMGSVKAVATAECLVKPGIAGFRKPVYRVHHLAMVMTLDKDGILHASIVDGPYVRRVGGVRL